MKLLEVEIPTREEYERLAIEYMDSLPLEHFMESPYNGHQRKITQDSFGLRTRLQTQSLNLRIMRWVMAA